jgi:hypothetical protein
MRSESTIFYHGFPVRGERFLLPPDTASLDPKTKREVTICNLFINHKLTITDIIGVLDEDYRHIVEVLLDRRIVEDRRQRHDGPPEGIERRRSQLQPAGRKGILHRS